MRSLVRAFLAGILGVLVCGGAWADTLWRVSDALGSDLGPASQGRQAAGWVLRIETKPGVEERTLFQNGLEDSTRLVDLAPDGRVVKFRDLRAGRLLWAVTYDPANGTPITETSFEEDQPFEVATLEFEAGVLFRRTVRDGDGKLLFTDTLGHWPDGSLRRLERDGPEGPWGEAAWAYGAGGSLVGAWLADGPSKDQGEHRVWSYGTGKTDEALMKGAQVLEARVTEWLEAGASKESRTVGTRTEVVVKDVRGRVTEDVVTDHALVVQTRRWVYDGQGRVVQTTVESGGPREVWTYRYDADGTVNGQLFRGEVLSREEVSRGGEKSQVRYYDQGKLFLTETWSGGKRTKETYYQNGAVVRERIP